MWEITIKGKFVTRITTDQEDVAKSQCLSLLRGKLKEGRIISEEPHHGLFQFVLESVEAEKL